MNYIKLSFFLLVVFASLAGAPQVFAISSFGQTVDYSEFTSVAGTSGTAVKQQLSIGSNNLLGTTTNVSLYIKNTTASTRRFDILYQSGAGSGHLCDAPGTSGWSVSANYEGIMNFDCTTGNLSLRNFSSLDTDIVLVLQADGSTGLQFGGSATSSAVTFSGGICSANCSTVDVLYMEFTGDYTVVPTSSFSNSNTRIITVDPVASSTVASSTPTTVGATYYVSDSDFDDDMILEIEVRNNAQNASQLVGPIFSLFQEQRFVYNYEQDITSSGLNSYASSTLFTQVGRYTAETKIKKPLFSVFGFGLLSQTVVATTTQFLVATTTAFDALQDGNIALAGQLSGVTSNLDCDGVLTSLSPRKFIACMFFFDYTGLQTVMNEARTGFLTSWPLGYGTRFVSILTDSATSSLPAINYTFGTTSPLYVLGLTSIELDPFAELSDPENIVNTKSDQTQQKSVMEIMSQIINIIVYLTLAFMIIHDLTNVMKHHHRK